MLWIKAFHVIFVVMWFAGMLYLPRLFVYHADTSDSVSLDRFKIMERKLFVIMTAGGVGAVTFGLTMLVLLPQYLQQGWLHAKLTLVLCLIGYHAYLGVVLARFRRGENRRGQVFYRWLNELPALLLIAIVILVVVKPF